jgi:hypothetical protein
MEKPKGPGQNAPSTINEQITVKVQIAPLKRGPLKTIPGSRTKYSPTQNSPMTVPKKEIRLTVSAVATLAPPRFNMYIWPSPPPVWEGVNMDIPILAHSDFIHVQKVSLG